jgi:hypothetical protein
MTTSRVQSIREAALEHIKNGLYSQYAGHEYDCSESEIEELTQIFKTVPNAQTWPIYDKEYETINGIAKCREMKIRGIYIGRTITREDLEKQIELEEVFKPIIKPIVDIIFELRMKNNKNNDDINDLDELIQESLRQLEEKLKNKSAESKK